MKSGIVVCAFALMLCTSCSLGKMELPSQSKTQDKKSFPKRDGQEPPPPLAVKDKLLFPTILHPNDQTTMVLINTGEKLQPTGIKPFYMDLYEITVKKFTAFNPKYSEKPYIGNQLCPNCPAMGIDWFSAREYCRWAGKRLPTEAEWELAARGLSGNAWPWGNEFLPKYANLDGNEDGYALAAPVGSFPQGASPYGVLDMVGNVWEWVDNSAGKETQKTLRIVKGGGWTTPTLALPFRGAADPATKNPVFGFRCSKSLN